MAKKLGGTRLDPSANDRWWRDRIAKEEQSLNCCDPAARSGNQQSYTINTLGALQPVPRGAETHLVGVGAVVRGGKNQYQDPDSYVPTGAGRSKPAASVARSQGSEAGSQARSRAKSTSTITSTAVLSRLERLEQELIREKNRREAAEQEMRELLARSNGEM